jgi:hypothetical protein
VTAAGPFCETIFFPEGTSLLDFNQPIETELFLKFEYGVDTPLSFAASAQVLSLLTTFEGANQNE